MKNWGVRLARWDGYENLELTGVWSSAMIPSSRGLKSVLLCELSSLVTWMIATSMVLCINELTFSSIWTIAIFVVFSISRLTVVFDAASGIKTVLMHDTIRCIVVIIA